jgi:hypothetical protein
MMLSDLLQIKERNSPRARRSRSAAAWPPVACPPTPARRQGSAGNAVKDAGLGDRSRCAASAACACAARARWSRWTRPARSTIGSRRKDARLDRRGAPSGLRGRGGAGYPTGLKWARWPRPPATKKYVICNADEGDPGAFMDRSVLESDPHRVLEGMAIAAYAVGADQGYIYVRAEYPLAIERCRRHQAGRQLGLLGQRHLEHPSTSTSTCASAPAPSSAARKPR